MRRREPYETMTGALVGHLLLLGIAQGTLLGAAGGVARRALAAARDDASKSRLTVRR